MTLKMIKEVANNYEELNKNVEKIKDNIKKLTATSTTILLTISINKLKKQYQQKW